MSKRWDRVLPAACLIALALGLVGLTRWFDARKSITYDEGLYLGFGCRTYQLGEFWDYLEYGCAPLPILLPYALPGNLAPYPVPVEQVAMRISQARLTHVLCLGVPLLVLVGGWLWRRRGPWVGVCGAALLLGSPVLLAQASLATTDVTMTLTTLLALLALVAYRRARTRRRYGLLCLGVAVALTAKYTAAFLLPMAVWAMWPEADWRRRLGRVCGLAGVALLVLWAAHGFQRVPLLQPGNGLWLESLGVPKAWATRAEQLGTQVGVPAPIMGILYQVSHVKHGHGSFLDGERGRFGWWRFYPLAFLYKSTPVEWLLAGLLVLSLRAPPDETQRVWRVAMAAYFGFLCLVTVNIGQRLLLVLYVLMVLLVVDWLASRLAGARLAVAGGLLVAAQWASVGVVAPHWLGYFNPAVGGPSQGWTRLVDCNLDWGQDLPGLRAFLASQGTDRVALAAFGYVSHPDAHMRPAAYGLVAENPLAPERAEWLAVSATELQGVNDASDPLGALRDVPPDARVHYSLFVWRLSRPEVRAALAEGRRRVRGR